MDGHGLKLEKIGQFFLVFKLYMFQKSSRKLLWLALADKNSFDIFVVALKEHFVSD